MSSLDLDVQHKAHHIQTFVPGMIRQMVLQQYQIVILRATSRAHHVDTPGFSHATHVSLVSLEAADHTAVYTYFVSLNNNKWIYSPRGAHTTHCEHPTPQIPHRTACSSLIGCTRCQLAARHSFVFDDTRSTTKPH